MEEQVIEVPERVEVTKMPERVEVVQVEAVILEPTSSKYPGEVPQRNKSGCIDCGFLTCKC